MSDQPKKENFRSPLAVAKWVTLGKPDTKYKAEGEYRVTLSLPKDAPETVKFLAQLDGFYAVAVKAVKDKLLSDPKTKLKAKTLKTSNAPYKADLDQEGYETGNVLVSFKAKASGVRIDKKTGEKFPWVFKPGMFDAKGVPITKETSVWGGSKLRVSYQVSDYYVAASGEAGLSLKLQAVQIIDLKTGGGRDASAYGFEEEEGYSADSDSAGATGNGETPADGGDF